MSADSIGDAGSLVLGLIDAVSDLRKRLDRHDTRLDDHEARFEELELQSGLLDGMTDEDEPTACDEDCPHVHVRADISLDDGFETVYEEVEE